MCETCVDINAEPGLRAQMRGWKNSVCVREIERIKKKMAQYKTRKIKTPGGGGYVYDVHLCWSNTFLTLSQKPLLITFPMNLEPYKCIIISEVHHNFADKEE